MDKAAPFPKEQLDYYLVRMNETPNPMLKARYADILVEYGAPVIKKFEAAQTLIPHVQACIRLHLAQAEPARMQALMDLDRLAHVSLSLRQKPFVTTTVEMLDEVVHHLLTNNDYRRILDLASIVHAVATSAMNDLMPADRVNPYYAALERCINT